MGCLHSSDRTVVIAVNVQRFWIDEPVPGVDPVNNPDDKTIVTNLQSIPFLAFKSEGRFGETRWFHHA